MKKQLLSLSLLLSICITYATDLNELSAELSYLECELKPLWRASKQHNPEHYFSHPLIPVTRGSSTNWAGYAAATNLQNPAKDSVSYVSGSWVVPTISPSSPSSETTYCAIWVGIDGYSSPSVEQIGTEHDWNNGQQVHYAWFEMYPQYSYQINGFPVTPGDSISASVKYQGNGVFVLSITNNTKKVYTVIPTSYTTSQTAQRSCAEWVVEAPYMNTILPLAHFTNPIQFSKCVTTINGKQTGINGQGVAYDALTMVTSNNQAKATPSALSTNGQAFSVSWKHQ